MAGPTIDAAGRRCVVIDLPEAEVVLYPDFFPAAEADRLLDQLVETTQWRQDSMKMFGELKPLPRLTAWYGDPGAVYVYSGIVNEPLPWTAALAEIKQAVDVVSGVVFNGVLLNRYRTGRDSMGWHSDDEPEFGDQPGTTEGESFVEELKAKTPPSILQKLLEARMAKRTSKTIAPK